MMRENFPMAVGIKATNELFDRCCVESIADRIKAAETDVDLNEVPRLSDVNLFKFWSVVDTLYRRHASDKANFIIDQIEDRYHENPRMCLFRAELSWASVGQWRPEVELPMNKGVYNRVRCMVKYGRDISWRWKALVPFLEALQMKFGTGRDAPFLALKEALDDCGPPPIRYYMYYNQWAEDLFVPAELPEWTRGYDSLSRFIDGLRMVAHAGGLKGKILQKMLHDRSPENAGDVMEAAVMCAWAMARGDYSRMSAWRAVGRSLRPPLWESTFGAAVHFMLERLSKWVDGYRYWHEL